MRLSHGFSPLSAGGLKSYPLPRLISLLLGLLLITLSAPRTASSSLQPNAYKFSSSAIAITPLGNLLLTANPDSNSLSLVDTLSRSVLAEIPVGLYPLSVAVSPSGLQAYTANQGGDSLSVIALPAGVVTGTIPLGDRPSGVAASPDGRLLAVSETGDDRVRLLDAQGLATVLLIPVADRPYGLAFTPDSRRLLVTHLLSGQATLLTVQPYRSLLPLVSAGSNAGVPEPLPASLLESPAPIIFSATLATWPQVAPAPGAAISADGARAYLAQTMANGLGYNTGFDTSVFPKVSTLNLLTLSHQLDEHISLPETDRPVGLPWDIALARGGQELWVVNSASNDLSVIDLSNPTRPRRQANIPVGDNPRGIAISPDGASAYVNNTLAGTVSLIDAASYLVTEVITVTTLPLPPAMLHGKRLYFSSAQPELAMAAWISCNTCHVEGEADGRTWKLQYLGEVPPGQQPVITRNTTSLLGMIETYPLRWSAEWDESADSEFSVRFEQFGSGLIPEGMNPTLGPPNQGRSYDLDCLAMFIDSLEVPPRAHTLTEQERRGQAIFESPGTQCAVCHPAPLYTDLLQHDVGTADGPGEWFGPLIDTPSLRFLFDSAPYLHDGSAASMLEVLTVKNPADQHGLTSHLTPPELQDLIAYLLSLP
ncbi:MAG: hypothetical protein JXB15_09610 [Anaerolineales bacterium]|nr:hypothetical protein [Anaerolineales bacterium]